MGNQPRTKETKILIKLGARSGSLEWDAERKQLFLLSGGKISIIEIEKKKKKPVKIEGEMQYGDWMENNETAPQFEVKNMPGMVDQGRDQQLEKAIEELLKDVK